MLRKRIHILNAAVIGRISFLCCTIVLVLGTMLTGCDAALETKDDNFLRQKGSQVKLFRLALKIAEWQRETGFPPESLAVVCDSSEDMAHCMQDYWGRQYYYRVTYLKDGYVLACFGKDGKPEIDPVEPGGFSEDDDYDADIVVISGEWAQSAGGLERPDINEVF